jgi:hypothetical protein
MYAVKIMEGVEIVKFIYNVDTKWRWAVSFSSTVPFQ